MLSQKWAHLKSHLSISLLAFKKNRVSKMRACWLTFKKSMYFKNKYNCFSNFSLFVSGQFWVHDVLKNKRFCLCYKNPVLTVYSYQNISLFLWRWSFKIHYDIFMIHTMHAHNAIMLLYYIYKPHTTSLRS